MSDIQLTMLNVVHVVHTYICTSTCLLWELCTSRVCNSPECVCAQVHRNTRARNCAFGGGAQVHRNIHILGTPKSCVRGGYFRGCAETPRFRGGFPVCVVRSLQHTCGHYGNMRATVWVQWHATTLSVTWTRIEKRYTSTQDWSIGSWQAWYVLCSRTRNYAIFTFKRRKYGQKALLQGLS